MRKTVLFVLATLGAVTPALAAPSATVDRTGYTAIAAGDLSTAEQRIVAERKIFPQRPELMLNLASVYHRTGRESEARALYAAVLARPAVAMDLPSGAVLSSHDIASRALGQQTQQIATR
ncbi:tetratricopeptide repeat protein [Sphingomonas sp. LB2R24]|jgi:Flp pilus assembly protein TadD|uniref:tetratricopeptide repeat protein n=1 Tax=Sphingomonas TaxID=13687 RepID=UPI0010489EDD|nr:tetratricopeptide repeat protein [Sphingomonas sp. PP-CC-3A-396]TCQ10656.1 tetratricopeptide repeat protein [Sphingomonas sp. PP-CC-3A-396]